jgi:hypothetical protein
VVLLCGVTLQKKQKVEEMAIRRTAAPLGDSLWAIRSEGVMLLRDIESAWDGMRGKTVRGIAVDHTRTAFALTGLDLVGALNLADMAPVPVAYVLRPDTLPIYAPLICYLGRNGIKRRAFLCQQEAASWLARRAE